MFASRNSDSTTSLGELAHFEQEFAEYLESPRGRFEAWYAAGRR
jgi:hypothetical protein